MRSLKTLVVVLVSAAVLVVGGAYVYIHFIEGDAPAKLTLQSDPTSTTTGGTTGTVGSDVSGTWSAGSGSQAGYRVKEVLFGQSNTAVGRTSGVTGELAIDGTTVSRTKITVDMTTVKSDQARRDGQFQGRIMDTGTYPTATFELTKPIELGPLPGAGATVTKQATGTLTLRGTTKQVTVDLTARRSAATIEVQGSIRVLFADWKIPNPSFATITTEDHGELEFLVAFTK
jgi:polyisoprenoid-binding protein YceI